MMSFSRKSCYNVHGVPRLLKTFQQKNYEAFFLDMDSIMVYGWTMKREDDGQDKES